MPQLATRSVGRGSDRALLLHCSLSHGGAWGPIASHLLDTLTMQTPDFPGHGRSAGWDGEGDYHHLSTHAALDLIDGPLHLIGHSFGATVALRIAAMRPDLVRSLTLIDTVFFAVAIQDKGAGLTRFDAVHSPINAALEAGRSEDAARLFMAEWGDGRPWEALPEAQKAYASERIHLIPAAEKMLVGDSAGLLRPGALEPLTMPVLLLQGADSPPIIRDIHQGLARRIPQAERVEIASARHMVPVTHPKPTAMALTEFLSRV
ncbi:Pimeloyl-ACP methyl ester carboxylesterase [Poseidonocella pacifica]|uniref:Pimeloyl-ACP methyl ester carboxylesterase n=1 Tax=Poseidonocella pacifica TaxID=871651 RepID=A0A1I0XGP9_9RHOB|nr:alpha/beta hydrolase [Poseidonocella pacifica]SFA99480.1 Pimeloyl-ACP methyl ester carboxylesterase [Poseidonocella pacifica]